MDDSPLRAKLVRPHEIAAKSDRKISQRFAFNFAIHDADFGRDGAADRFTLA